MKDYKLSELKEICNTNHSCASCPARELCKYLEDGVAFLELDIDEELKNENTRKQ
jgi:hypothetical protein